MHIGIGRFLLGWRRPSSDVARSFARTGSVDPGHGARPWSADIDVDKRAVRVVTATRIGDRLAEGDDFFVADARDAQVDRARTLMQAASTAWTVAAHDRDVFAREVLRDRVDAREQTRIEQPDIGRDFRAFRDVFAGFVLTGRMLGRLLGLLRRFDHRTRRTPGPSQHAQFLAGSVERFAFAIEQGKRFVFQTVPIHRDGRGSARWAFGIAVGLFPRLAFGAGRAGRSALRCRRRVSRRGRFRCCLGSLVGRVGFVFRRRRRRRFLGRRRRRLHGRAVCLGRRVFGMNNGGVSGVRCRHRCRLDVLRRRRRLLRVRRRVRCFGVLFRRLPALLGLLRRRLGRFLRRLFGLGGLRLRRRFGSLHFAR